MLPTLAEPRTLVLCLRAEVETLTCESLPIEVQILSFLGLSKEMRKWRGQKPKRKENNIQYISFIKNRAEAAELERPALCIIKVK